MSELVQETRAFAAELVERSRGRPKRHLAPLAQTRAAREHRPLTREIEPLTAVHDIEVPSRAGPVRLRVIRPSGEAAGAFLHFHGGGHVFGSPDEHDGMLSEFGEATGLATVSVEYALAPERPYPAAADDCEAAALWLLAECERELGVPAVFAIGGESAGAHLAAVTLLRLRDRHGIAGAFRGASLFYGLYDLSTTPSRRRWSEDVVFTAEELDWLTDQLLPGLGPEQRRDSAVSPLYADLRGLPPAFFTAGTRDPFLDDTLFMEVRWRLAGNRTELHVVAEAPHGYMASVLEASALTTDLP